MNVSTVTSIIHYVVDLLLSLLLVVTHRETMMKAVRWVSKGSSEAMLVTGSSESLLVTVWVSTTARGGAEWSRVTTWGGGCLVWVWGSHGATISTRCWSRVLNAVDSGCIAVTATPTPTSAPGITSIAIGWPHHWSSAHRGVPTAASTLLRPLNGEGENKYIYIHYIISFCTPNISPNRRTIVQIRRYANLRLHYYCTQPLKNQNDLNAQCLWCF